MPSFFLNSLQKSMLLNPIPKRTEPYMRWDMVTIGRLDKKIYRCITDDISTDEVIITEKQIQHIKDRHPNDYERFAQYFSQIIADPDYILEANRPNTAFILKQIKKNNVNFQLILRLKTSGDCENYKNSIITFLKIEQKKWDKYLRNKKILYRKE